MKTYYYLKDIQFLSHEPIIKKLRSFKVFMRKVKKATDKKDFAHVRWLRDHRPKYKVDHIVKERYPTFIDAIRDLDDTLCMCFLFATFPSNQGYIRLVSLCHRLTIEFMHYIIESRSLRKVFISIKGYYYQAEIQGQTVTWVVPHRLPYQLATGVDVKIMSTFTEFYSTMLGFVNYKLFSLANLQYPPKVSHMSGLMGDKSDIAAFATDDEVAMEQLGALNQSLNRVVEMNPLEDPAIDEFPMSDNPEVIEKMKKEQAKLKDLQKLFEGLKFFIGREVPRDQIVFVIRSFGGEVSWDKMTNIGATYGEDDPGITHQIIDRPKIPKQLTSRYYVQPQWVFDCVNNAILLPVEDYFPGVILPPHLSPFVENADGDYVPPEKLVLLARQGVGNDEEEEEEVEKESRGSVRKQSNISVNKEEGDEQEEEEKVGISNSLSDQMNNKQVATSRKRKTKRKRAPTTVKYDNAEPKTQKRARMSVEPGKVIVVDEDKKAKEAAAEEKRLAIMMIPKKKKRLYKQIMYGKRKKLNEAAKLKEKRRLLDSQKSASKNT